MKWSYIVIATTIERMMIYKSEDLLLSMHFGSLCFC